MSDPIDPASTLPWRVGRGGALVSDKRTTPEGASTGHDDVEHYGGHLVAESVPPPLAAFIVARMNATLGHPDF